MTVSRLDLSAFPDSPYAAELRGGSASLRFEPGLEAQYVRSHLFQSRTLIRIASLLAAVLAVLRAVDEFVEHTWNSLFLVDVTAVAAISLTLAAIAYRSEFERVYLKRAQILVPLRNCIIAAQIAAAAAHGQLEMLMVLPITLLGPFFFLGLRFRTALVCCLATVAAYGVSATFFALAPQIALRSCVFLFVGGIACVFSALHVERGARVAFLERHLIAELAERDPLTGASNRRALDSHLDQLWDRAIEKRQPLAILLLDIDHFKAYNDRYGHQAGDQTLRRVAQTAQRFVRNPSDILARYGGEEFAVVLSDTNGEQALNIADRMRVAIGELGIEHRGSPTWSRVTISIGIAAVEPAAHRNLRGALQLADEALYTAKKSGRNRSELMDEVQHSHLVTGVFLVGGTSA